MPEKIRRLSRLLLPAPERSQIDEVAHMVLIVILPVAEWEWRSELLMAEEDG